MGDWFWRNKVVSLFVVLWAIGLVTYITLRLFDSVDAITSEAVAAYTALLGVPAAAFGLWKWRNSKKDGG